MLRRTELFCECGQVYLLDVIARKKSEESPGTTTNSDYAAALRILNEWWAGYRGMSHDVADFESWLMQRLHSEEPNVA